MKWVHRYPEVASTNDTLRDLARAGAPSGTAVVSETQTQGRGRHGRQWFSPSTGNLHLSVLHRSFLDPTKLSGLTLDIAVAAATAIEDVTGLRVGLKWPNDLVCDGYKLGGILTELHAESTSDGTIAVIIGLGLNVNLRRETLPEALHEIATTLRDQVGAEVDLERLTLTVIRHIREKLAGYELEGSPDLVAYRARFPFIGHAVEADSRRGEITDVLDDGALEVRWEGEALPSAVRSGEVHLVGAKA